MIELDKETLRVCEALPKIELHAHLNGSIRASTLRELALANGLTHKLDAAKVGDPPEVPTSAPKRTLPECFALFDLIHSITTTHAAIQRIVTEVIEDFEADGCVYLELRTTPKARPECSMTKRSYMHAVMSGIADFYENKGSCTGGEPSIDVQLLLSINRSESSIEAMDTVELALELSAEEGSRVVGVDLGGNPAVGCWEHWLGALEKARAGGLGVTLHCAEVWNEDESAKMVAWRPGRLGHMCCMGQALTQQLLASQVPVEICLSSNWVTGSVDSYDAHHFRDLYSKGHPVVLCTDDTIFGTRLSMEYALAAQTFGLTRHELADLALSAADMAFLHAGQRAEMKGRMEAAVHTLLNSTPCETTRPNGMNN